MGFISSVLVIELWRQFNLELHLKSRWVWSHLASRCSVPSGSLAGGGLEEKYSMTTLAKQQNAKITKKYHFQFGLVAVTQHLLPIQPRGFISVYGRQRAVGKKNNIVFKNSISQ